MQLRPGHRLLVDRQLVAQGEVLKSELTVAAAEEREETKQVEEEGDHRAEILSGSEPTDQLLGCRIDFWRRTGTRPPGNAMISRLGTRHEMPS